MQQSYRIAHSSRYEPLRRTSTPTQTTKPSLQPRATHTDRLRVMSNTGLLQPYAVGVERRRTGARTAHTPSVDRTGRTTATPSHFSIRKKPLGDAVRIGVSLLGKAESISWINSCSGGPCSPKDLTPILLAAVELLSMAGVASSVILPQRSIDEISIKPTFTFPIQHWSNEANRLQPCSSSRSVCSKAHRKRGIDCELVTSEVEGAGNEAGRGLSGSFGRYTFRFGVWDGTVWSKTSSGVRNTSAFGTARRLNDLRFT